MTLDCKNTITATLLFYLVYLKWHYPHPKVYSEWTDEDQNKFSFYHNSL
jgi:hypothetical protein